MPLLFSALVSIYFNHPLMVSSSVELGAQGVQVHPQKLWLGENLGKISRHWENKFWYFAPIL